MKWIFICLVSLCLFSCRGNIDNKIIEPEKRDTVFITKPIYFTDTVQISELNNEIILLKDSIKIITNKLTYENYINARRIEKIKYYIKITEKKPSNQKFFFGWIKRTMLN